MDTRTLYLAFLSARHIHFAAAFCIFLASLLALITLSAVLVTITTTKASVLLLPLVCQLVVWFCVFRPKVVAVAPSKEMRFRLVDRSPSYPSGSSRKKKIFRTGAEIAVEFASVYVAHTGYLSIWMCQSFGKASECMFWRAEIFFEASSWGGNWE